MLLPGLLVSGSSAEGCHCQCDPARVKVSEGGDVFSGQSYSRETHFIFFLLQLDSSECLSRDRQLVLRTTLAVNSRY